MTYAEYLQSEHWKSFASSMRRRRGLKCEFCQAADRPLEVHHKTYKNLGKAKGRQWQWTSYPT